MQHEKQKDVWGTITSTIEKTQRTDRLKMIGGNSDFKKYLKVTFGHQFDYVLGQDKVLLALYHAWENGVKVGTVQAQPEKHWHD